MELENNAGTLHLVAVDRAGLCQLWHSSL